MTLNMTDEQTRHPLPVDAMKKALELADYTFTDVSWSRPSGAFNTLSTGMEELVKDDWKHALDNGVSEVDLVSVARGCNMTDTDVHELLKGMFPNPVTPAWEGVGQPPVGTVLWVVPCNTLWGFDMVDTYLCEVMAYDGEYVWLKLLSDTGEVVLAKYVTTRTDKVEVKVWKGNNDA